MSTPPVTTTTTTPPVTEPTTTPPVTTPPVTAPPPPTTGGGATNDWASGFKDTALRDWAINKGFKDAEMVANSYQGLEKLIGVKDQLVTIPKDESDKAGWDAVHTRLGRPAKAEDYKIEMPKEGGDEKFVGSFKQAAFEAGLSGKQAAGLVAWFNKFGGDSQTAAQEADKVAGGAAVTALKSEWGAAYDSNIAMVDSAAAKLGMDVKQLDGLKNSLGHAGALKFIHGIAVKLGGEAEFVGGNSGGGAGAMTPAAAQAAKAEHMKDDTWRAKYLAGGVEEKKQMDHWNKMILAANA